jgi:hypothetical protein
MRAYKTLNVSLRESEAVSLRSAEDAARELPNLPLDDAPAGPALCGEGIGELRESGDALA